jgi:enoyl-CoA hydratase/carnithine racemase
MQSSVNTPTPTEASTVLAEVCGRVGFITLNRPKALNALSLEMVRLLTDCLLAWRDDVNIQAVAIRGTNKHGAFGAFCAGGDIRFFHQAAVAGDTALGDFFTEEYRLNHLIHTYSKPYIAFMDGIVMGGGMGISQGASHRLVTERTKMAMPETHIGLFPDVGGGYFLSRCPGRCGEWMGLTGEVIGAGQAIALGLADGVVAVEQLQSAWDALATMDLDQPEALASWLAIYLEQPTPYSMPATGKIDHYFALETVQEIVRALEGDNDLWAQQTAATLRKRSPLMLQVVLEQIRRARTLSLDDDLRMERDMVHHCFNPEHLGRNAAQSETVEGIRALAVDKDHTPRWNPVRIEEVTEAMVSPFFNSPWTPEAHPLSALR